MNLTQAEAVASLYEELLKSIDRESITPPPGPKMHMGDAVLEDGQIKIHWSRYVGCGEYETEDTYHSLDSLFQ